MSQPEPPPMKGPGAPGPPVIQEAAEDNLDFGIVNGIEPRDEAEKVRHIDKSVVHHPEHVRAELDVR